ncbi:MAG: ABC transporter ATP-binding protein [Actinobacteria bacterium]|nr:ABC transporter ATP-binding protein [Actinomycetota bacterium]
MSRPEVLLDIRGLHAGYGEVEIVHGLDLRVHAGEVVALLGPNGAGKTTTLRTVSALLPLLAGEVDVLSVSLRPRVRGTRGVGPTVVARAGVAHVPEDRGLFFGLTGREHLRLAARRGDHAAVDEVLAAMPHLAAVVDRKAGLMSGGEQQMLAIARALVARPRLVMLDELSLGLAPIVVQQLLPLVRGLAREHDLGVLLVEQYVTAALAVADRAHVLFNGRVVLTGEAAALLGDQDRIARSYLGLAE